MSGAEILKGARAQDVRNVLIKARSLIDTPEKWTKGAYSLQKPTGWCYCASGAIDNASSNIYVQSAARSVLKAQLPHGSSIPAFNDEGRTTHADVLALFDRAIEVLK